MFGTKIKDLRKERNFTLKDLSEKSGIEITYLSKIENNKTGVPEIRTIDKLITALDVDEKTKEELFRLAGQIPPDIKNSITERKDLFDVFRVAKDLNENELLELVQQIKKKKHEKNTKK